MFEIGDKVRKVKGYMYFGIVVAKFLTTSSQLRYVVENVGVLFIFNEGQLELDV